MPVVRKFGQRKVVTQVRPSARATNAPGPEVFGAQLGATLSAIGTAGFEQVIKQERQKADELALLQANNKLASWEAKRLLDPDTGALTIKGENSFELPELVGGEFDQVAGEIADGLSTDRQREAFERARSVRKQRLDLQLRRHVFTEMQVFDEQETNASIANDVNDAIAHAGDAEHISEALARIDLVITDHSRRQGISTEATDQRRATARSAVHTGVIERLLAQRQDLKARAYFDETRDQISGSQQAQLERAMEIGSVRGESQRQTDEIMLETETQTEALARAREITDPAVRDATVDRVRQRFARLKQQSLEDREALMIEAANQIDAGGLDSVPPGTLSRLMPAERQSLKRYADPGPVEKAGTNWATYAQLMNQAGTDHLAFAEVNLHKYRHLLADAEFKQLLGIQRSVRDGERNTATKELASFSTIKLEADRSLGVMGIDTSMSSSNKERDKVARFYRRVTDQVELLKQLTGKSPTPLEVRAISDDILMTPITIEGSFGGFFRPGPVRDLTTTAFAIEIGDISAANRTLVEDRLRANGVAVTDDSVMNAFINWQRSIQAPR